MKKIVSLLLALMLALSLAACSAKSASNDSASMASDSYDFNELAELWRVLDVLQRISERLLFGIADASELNDRRTEARLCACIANGEGC